MAFIRVQNLKRDEQGRVLSGSASIVDTSYVSGARYHSRQTVRESLGRVVWLADDRRSGLFLSQFRGLVAYDADSDSFSPVDPADRRRAGIKDGAAPASVMFGDAYWLLLHMREAGVMEALAGAFPDPAFRSRLVCHMLHRVLGAAGTGADEFLAASLASALFPDIDPAGMRCDTLFLLRLGEEDGVRAFFRAWGDSLRGRVPDFGRAVLVDTAGLPWAAPDLLPGPFVPSESSVPHGGLTLVCDAATMDPIWFDVHGDGAGAEVLRAAARTAHELTGARVASWCLDGAWLGKDLLRELLEDGSAEVTALAPPRRDFEPKELFREHVRPCMGRRRYEFSCAGRAYFGRRVEASLFGRQLGLCLYVDRDRAARGAAEFMRRHPGEHDELGGFRKDWLAARYGFFALLSNQDETPERVLEKALERVELHDGLLFPAAGRSRPAAGDACGDARGGMFLDVVAAVVRRGAAARAASGGMSLRRLLAALRSLRARAGGEGLMLVDTPDARVADCFALLGAAVPACLRLKDFRASLGMEEGVREMP